MARIRTIKPEFWTHEVLSGLPEATHMLAAALLNYADDEGYFNAHPGLIRAACCPLREPSVSIPDSLTALSDVGYLELGNGSDGKRYGRIVKFDEHQRVNRPTPSKIKGLVSEWESSTKTHGQLTEDSPPERNREQGREGEQGTGNPSLRSGSSPTGDAGQGPAPAEPVKLAEKRQARLREITQDAIAAYNAMLTRPRGLLPFVKPGVGTKAREKQVARIIDVASDICRAEYGDPKITRRFWDDVFGLVREDDFLSGRRPPGAEHPNWRPDFEFLTRPKTLLRLYDDIAEDDGEPGEDERGAA